MQAELAPGSRHINPCLLIAYVSREAAVARTGRGRHRPIFDLIPTDTLVAVTMLTFC